MHNKKVYDIRIALDRIKSYCALQDRCQWDVLQKLNEWGLQQATKDHILEILITDKFVDEERFSVSFCRGKFRIKNWGKRKITNELKRKQISTICINIGLEEIDDNEEKDIDEQDTQNKSKPKGIIETSENIDNLTNDFDNHDDYINK